MIDDIIKLARKMRRVHDMSIHITRRWMCGWMRPHLLSGSVVRSGLILTTPTLYVSMSTV